MSAYDDAVAYLDSEVHPRCDYDIYSDMRGIVDEMEAENERLRKECTALRKAREREFAASCEAATNHMLEVGKLRDENAKLRELVRIAIEYCDSGTCDGCPIQFESGGCPYSVMARELGVEV